MAIRTEEMTLTDVEIARIKPEVAPLPQEKSLKKSLIVDEQSEQVNPVMLRRIEDDDYDYEIVDGRRRVETLRQGEVSHVRAIVTEIDDKMLHVAALIGNSGTPNPADEAEHMQYLRDKEGMAIEDISHLTGLRLPIVKGRLRIADGLTRRAFEMLRNGEITYTTACDLVKIEAKEKQQRILRTLKDSGKEVTGKVIKEYYKKAQKRTIEDKQKDAEALFEVDDNSAETFVAPVILTHNQMQKLINDQTIDVVYNGEKYCLTRCEL